MLSSLWWSTKCSFLFYLCSVVHLSICLWLHFKYFTWFDIATMHAWIQLAIALAYVLMYYYGNTGSSISRDLTRRQSLIIIIISVWLFGESICSKIQSYRVKIFWETALRPPIFWHVLHASVLCTILEYQVVIKLHSLFSIDLILMLLQPDHLKTWGTGPVCMYKFVLYFCFLFCS